MKKGDPVRVNSMEATKRAQQKEASEFLRKPYMVVYVLLAFIDLLVIILGESKIIFGIAAIITLAVGWGISNLFYTKYKSSFYVKYVDFLCYFISYLMLVIISKSSIVTLAILPIIIFALLYFDQLYMKVVCGVSLGFITTYTVCSLLLNVSTIEKQVLDNGVVLFLGILTIVSLWENSRQANRFNEIAGKVIGEKMGEIGGIIGEVFQVTKAVQDKAGEVDEIVNSLDDSTQIVTSAIKEISLGVQDTATSIQHQTVMTQTIQEEMEKTLKISGDVVEYAKASEASVTNGLNLVDQLLIQADIMTDKNKNVVSSMETLTKKAKEVQKIISIILNISNEINLLSLNASIESARAGEAGRGFAVVAGHIRNLAGQTKVASENISDIIKELNDNATKAATVIKSSVETADLQKELIDSAELDFKNISSKVKLLNDSIAEMNLSIKHLVNSNNEIVGSISQISATDEEISANTLEAAQLSQKNLRNTQEVKALIHDLVSEAKRMEKFHQ